MRNVPKTKPKDKRNVGQELKASIDSRLDRLAKALDDIQASAEYKAYLDVQARFHKYSWHNCLLILSQRPSATHIAGYRAWQQLKRHVRKGERSIRILAPHTFKRETADGDTERGMYFRAVSVFDVSQTDGEPLPEFDCPDVQSDGAGLLAGLCRVAVDRGIKVEFAEMADGEYGESRGGHVRINTLYATGQQAKTLAHELAHESLHKGKENRRGLTRTIAELEAESVAYVVCGRFGLDVEIRASRYISLYGGDSKALRASLDRISKTAKAIIADCEKAVS